MRRTMFMVPPDLASVMYAAATRDVVANERRKLLKMFQTNHETADAEAWLEQVSRGVGCVFGGSRDGYHG